MKPCQQFDLGDGLGPSVKLVRRLEPVGAILFRVRHRHADLEGVDGRVVGQIDVVRMTRPRLHDLAGLVNRDRHHAVDFFGEGHPSHVHTIDLDEASVEVGVLPRPFRIAGIDIVRPEPQALFAIRHLGRFRHDAELREKVRSFDLDHFSSPLPLKGINWYGYQQPLV